MKFLRNLILSFQFLVFYFMSLLLSNLRIAKEVLTPGLGIQPGFLRIPLRTENDFEILIFSNLIAMTPGTLSLDIAEDRKFIYLHVLYLQEANEVRYEIAEVLQSRVLEVLRLWK